MNLIKFKMQNVKIEKFTDLSLLIEGNESN
jgi:hypothetical protein